ncbi:methyltransferase [Polymorphum gilvum]|uniref:Methyltransferase small n=1 Tax=Polymorphum gilvum (strain LMG 25793 / CGMCC 1.9160 / SL003B-26A1) TaxID=991905 RepID=F2IY38_POLGS|nr:methyltransferase [Polymorphum gilvum]ADZ70541.1 Methyltransferase small [Polymorphum gilvum SL003B-26A1]
MLALTSGTALQSVCQSLERAGLRDLFACGDPLHPRYERWLHARANAPERLRPLVDVFLLGRAAPRADLGALRADALDALLQSGVLKATDGGALHLGGLCLLPTLGVWLLCQVPQPGPTLYYGDDSVGLAWRLSAKPGDRALDLCAGPGIQALRLAAMGAEVVAVEINPVAASLAQLNAAANGLGERISVRIGSLYQAVGARERFDLVSANPPLLPVPDNVPYPFVGHGGPDGLSITRRILDGLPGVLSERGVARLLGTTLSDGYLPLCLEEMETWARTHAMDMIMFVTSHFGLAAGDAYLEGLAQTSAATGRISLDEARARYLACFAARGASHMCAYFFHIVPGRGSFDLADLAEEPPRDIWFAH